MAVRAIPISDNPANWTNVIRLTFAPGATPGIPIALRPDSTKKLSELRQITSAIEKAFATQVSGPTMWGGDVCLKICPPGELLGAEPSKVLADLRLTARQIIANADTRALPLRFAVDHPHCIDVLRAISHARQRSEFSVVIEVGSDREEFHELHPRHFTDGKNQENEVVRIRMVIEGVCRSTPDALVVLLCNSWLLHLPVEHYEMSSLDLFRRIEGDETAFVGEATPMAKNTYIASPGGKLQTQLALC